MDAAKAVLTRRSIRKYKPEPVPEELEKSLLEAAMSAPSARNQQPWQFVVIRSREVLNRIAEGHPHAQMCREAPLAIAVCGDLKIAQAQEFWTLDCAAATENILIMANALGLGAVWVSVYPREERIKLLKEVLQLPEHVVPLSLVPVGWPAEEKPPENRFHPVRIHYDRW